MTEPRRKPTERDLARQAYIKAIVAACRRYEKSWVRRKEK